MKQPAKQLTWEQIQGRLAYADKLRKSLIFHKRPPELAPHLQQEERELIDEAYRRPEAWSF